MSGTVNPQIPLGINTQYGQNNLEQLGQTAATLGALMNVRRGNEEFQSRQAVGGAASQAIDPATGHFDLNRFRQLMSQNPLSQYMSLEALGQASEIDIREQQLKIQQAQLGFIRLNNLRQSIAGLLANPSVTPDMVMSEIGKLSALPENERPFSPTMAAQVLGSMPRNPAELRNWLISQMARTDAGLQQIGTFLPQPMAIPNGGGTQILNRDPITGRVTDNTSVVNTPPTSEMNQLVQIYNPQTRQMLSVPRFMAGPMVNGGGWVVANPNQQGQSTFGNGRYPGTTPQVPPGAPPLSPPGAVAPIPGVIPGVGAAATPPLGAEQAAARIGDVGGTQVGQLQTAAAEVPNMRSMLSNLNGLLDQFQPGPGADWQKTFQAWVNRNVPGLQALGVQFDPARIGSQEEFNKIASQIAQAQFRALGGSGSNDQLASAMSTSPNEYISQYGNKAIVALLRGNTEALDVQHRAWNNWARANSAGPERFGEFLSEWNRHFDPRVFQSTFMSPAERARMVSSMSRQEYEQYVENWRYAIANGWVRNPTGTNPGRQGTLPAAPDRAPAATVPAAPPVSQYQDPRLSGYRGP